MSSEPIPGPTHYGPIPQNDEVDEILPRLADHVSNAYQAFGLLERFYARSTEDVELLNVQAGGFGDVLYGLLVYDVARRIRQLLEDPVTGRNGSNQNMSLGRLLLHVTEGTPYNPEPRLAAIGEQPVDDIYAELDRILQQAYLSRERIVAFCNTQIAHLDLPTNVVDQNQLPMSLQEMLDTLDHMAAFLARFGRYYDRCARQPESGRGHGHHMAYVLLLRLRFAEDYSAAEDEGLIPQERFLRVHSQIER